MEFGVRILRGSVTVAYKRVGRKVHATALQFDLVGMGKTREQALVELQEVVNAYFLDALLSEESIDLQFPSPPPDWNVRDRQDFVVAVALVQPRPQRKFLPFLEGFAQLRPCREQVRSFSLLPLVASFGGSVGESCCPA